MKKFTPEEVQSKSDSVRKLADNIKILGDLFEEQQRNIGRAMRGVDEGVYEPPDDIEDQKLVKSASNGGVIFEGFRGKDNN